ncbi:MAG: biotin--[acetyl-CoA-carboxylase] ligase [Sphingomonas sp.]|nr:biotin--[acetyl-CoA-carboxylase] ligase [Sphingomonas sp.]
MIRTVTETGSTNADLIALARSGAEEGLWLRAERQTGGRGRQGRAWVSPEGNLYASTIVRLRPSDPPAATLALVAAVALEEAVRIWLPDAPILLKWPNDLLIAGAKLSGILLERVDNAVVIGIGVNIAHHPTDIERSATSMAAQGAAPEPGQFLETLAETFSRWLERWRGEGIGAIRDRWTARAHPEGTALQARLGDGVVIDGLYAGLNGDGALILRLADGTRHVIHAGDVFLI